ncbi:carbohydrate kinase family protein [Frondihabitans cladoniiphilus]|uniref:Carbohydrate kinase PfkB domain-containing protein n=1 Tax=Frondihabitans cladoniiphilus TaxID=715785 RepID=A0ABP8W0B3_9MICO
MVGWTLMIRSAPFPDPPSTSEIEPRILVFGDVLDDIIVSPVKAPRGDADSRAVIQHRAGGWAANTAAWIGSTGVHVELVGRVGVGDVQRHSQILATAGVHPRLGYARNAATGTVVITLDGGSRTTMVDRGASAELAVEEITAEMIDGFDVVHFTGYSFDVAGDASAVRGLIARIHAAGALASFDPGAVGLVGEIGAEAFSQLVEGVDLFFVTLAEGRLLAGVDDPDAVVRKLRGRFGVVALLLPDGGAVVGRRGAKTVHAAPVATRSADPIGAGAAFVAGFVASWVRSPSLAIAARRGTKLAALALATVGGRPAT